MQTSFDAVIVGGGPAGSTAAILLAQAGWRVALVEKQRFPRRKVCGECIAASNLPLLEALGVGAAVTAAAGPELRQVALMRGNRIVVADLPPAADGRYRWGRPLGRETLDSLLLEQAHRNGVQVMQPWSVRSVDGGPGEWRCDIRAIDSKEIMTLRAAVAVDAHGSWEAMPSERTDLSCSGSDLLAFKANFSGSSLKPGLLPVLSFDGGYGGMVLADQGILTVACCVRRDQVMAMRRTAPGGTAGEAVQAMLQRQCTGVQLALQDTSRIGPWLAAGPLAPGIRLHPNDQAFRIGNAAAEAHPIVGEGMSMAFQSAWLLCAHLVGAGDRRKDSVDVKWQRAVGQRYAADWHRQFALRLRLASTFAHLAMRPTFASPLLALVRAWPGLLPLGAKWSGKTCFIATTRSSP
jgi:2-polyprenyl-6-methoxyphenol hydroxylase-like FAD-dependent oxidoreductase